MEETLSHLVECLTQTMSIDRTTRQQAEKVLQNHESQQGYSQVLLVVVEKADLAAPVRVAAAVAFKNFVKRHWKPSESSDIAASDRAAVKGKIVPLMLNTPVSVRKQFSEAITLIGRYDFPDDWPDLLPALIEHFQRDNLPTISSCLETAHALFKRYRYEMKSNELWREIKLVLDAFAAPLTTLYRKTLEKANKLTGTEAADVAGPVVDVLIWISKIFHSLNAQELPEFFEDHMKEWMEGFIFLLKFESATLRAADESEEEPGRLEELRSAVIESITMYAQKYDEEFAPHLPPFVEVVWHLLCLTGPEAKFDLLVSNAIQFLASVCTRDQYKALFESEGTLEQICEKVVVPNLALRQSDQEMFEDNPDEYIRRDIEGSDVDTRRRSAADFVRSLCRHFENRIMAIFGKYIQSLFAEYAANPEQCWPKKEVALYLVIALAAKGQTSRYGATKTSDMVNLDEFFTSQVVDELSSVPNYLPLLKTACLKYLVSFRGQISPTKLAAAIPNLVKLMTSDSVVVRTYVCYCLERLLIIKDPANLKVGLIKSQQLAPVADLLSNLFGVLAVRGTEENEYVMKCLLRVLTALRESLSEYRDNVLDGLTKKLELVAKNPSRPHFNHYLFECYCVLIKTASIAEVERFEAALFDPFQAILVNEVTEFVPYVFQILGMMLNLREPNSGVPESYMALLPFLVLPALWERQGNIPALVTLLEAYVRVGSESVVAAGQLNPLLGVFQKLAASKTNDHEGFKLLRVILAYVDWKHVEPVMKGVLTVCFNRLQQSRTVKYSKELIVFLCLLAVKRGGQALAAALDSIQQGMLEMVVEKVVLRDVQKIGGAVDKKVASVGLTAVLVDCPQRLIAARLWAPLLQSLVAVFELPEGDSSDDADRFLELAEEYSAAYSQLAFASSGPLNADPTGVQDARAHLAKSLEVLSARLPLRNELDQLDPNAKAFLERYAQAAGVVTG